MSFLGIICNVFAIVFLLMLRRPSQVPYLVDLGTGERILRFGRSRKLLSLVIGIQLPLGIASTFYRYFESITMKELLTPDGLYIPIIFIGMIASGVYMFLESERFRIQITQDVMVVHRVFLKPQTIPWKHINSISYSDRTIKIQTVDRQKVDVSSMMDGISGFLETMLSNVYPSVCKKITEIILHHRLLPAESFDSEGKLIARGA